MDLFDTANNDSKGWERWKMEQKAREREIARTWNLPLGKRIRLRLFNLDGEFDGRLMLAAQPKTLDAHQPLKLRIGRMSFSSEEIEAWSLVNTRE